MAQKQRQNPKRKCKENSRLLQALPECCPSKQESVVGHISRPSTPSRRLPPVARPKTTGAKPRRRARRQFPAALHWPNQTLMRSAQIKGGGERRNENSLRPQGRPNPIIPITPANHTLMMGIKMCWPRSSASARQAPVQPGVSGFLWWWAAGGRTSLGEVRSSVPFGTAVWAAFGVGAVQRKVKKKKGGGWGSRQNCVFPQHGVLLCLGTPGTFRCRLIE